MKVQKCLRCSTISVFLLFGFTAHSALAETFLVDPTSSFRRAAAIDAPASPKVIDLSGEGFSGGHTLEFVVLSPTFYYKDPGCVRADPDLSRTPGPVTAIFSTTNQIYDAWSTLHRVPGAIDAGEDIVTSPAPPPENPVVTDIEEDFRVETGTEVVVPQSANYLILSSLDSWYKDNCVPGNDDEYLDYPRGYIKVDIAKSEKIIVDIDVKPGSYPNCFNKNNHGVIPVAILGGEHFYVTEVTDYGQLSFGGMAVRVRGKKGPMCHLDDSNGDGFTDLVCQFEDDESYWAPGTSEATLTGVVGTTPFEGTDEICVVQ